MYYRQTLHCMKCKWQGPWQIFRLEHREMGDGTIIDKSGWFDSCPECESQLAGSVEMQWHDDHEEPCGGRGCLYIWEERYA